MWVSKRERDRGGGDRERKKGGCMKAVVGSKLKRKII